MKKRCRSEFGMELDTKFIGQFKRLTLYKGSQLHIHTMVIKEKKKTSSCTSNRSSLRSLYKNGVLEYDQVEK